MTKLHHKKPNLQAWRQELLEKYDVRDIYFFADYSHPNLKSEVPRIREVSNMVIETQNTSSKYIKDFTDFIILDHIYQHAVADKNISCFIIFTGDGHFSSVVNFMRQKCGKEVGIYGVRYAMSGVLKSAASWCIEVPEEKKKPDEDMQCADKLLTYLKEKEAQKDYKGVSIPEAVSEMSKSNKLDSIKAKETINKLIGLGYITRYERMTDNNMLANVLRVDWIKMKKDDYWDDELKVE